MSEFATPGELDAERAVIGAAIVWPDVIDRIDLEPEQFHDLAWRAAWAAIQTLREAGQPVDEVTIAAQLERDGIKNRDVVTRLGEAAQSVPTGDNVEYYAALVRQGWVTRSVVLAMGEVRKALADGQRGEELLAAAQEAIGSVVSGAPASARRIGEIVKDRFAELNDIAERRAHGDVTATGIPTGIEALDELLGGLQSCLTLVAARPAMGKSSLALTLANNVNALGIGVHVFNLEDIEAAYADRSLAHHSSVAADQIRQVRLSSANFGALRNAARELWGREGWLVDSRSALTAREVVRGVRRHAKQNKTRLVIVDYATILRGEGRTRDIKDVVNDAATTLMEASKDGIAYVLLAQLNRDCEKRDDKRPMLSDLKESGALEERAKCVIFPYRPAVHADTEDERLIELIVRKNNFGRIGTIRANWHGPTARVF